MCGIAGIIDGQGGAISSETLRRMMETIRHRGPDGEGIYLNSQAKNSSGRGISAALGHRRLKIIDLSTGDQPMSNEDDSIWIIFNGEIYNYLELRRELSGLGHTFRTHSDTEVIVHAYEQFGPDCVNRLWGMFAFGLWDEKRQRCLLARDRLGKKPLVYAEFNGQILFASEIQALLAHPSVGRIPNMEAIHHYLTYGCVPFPWTAFTGIRKLPPAHYLLYENRELSLHPYWRLDFSQKRRITEQEASEELLRILEEAVRIRLHSDVPLGVFLSGGMDSSTVVALAARFKQKVKTFSIGFEESSYNELPFARSVANQFATEHHEEVVRPDAAALLPSLIRHYGEPFADSSAVPSFYLARFARKSVTVALNGDGGDEAFGGYVRHLAMRWADRFHKLPPRLQKSLAGSFLPPESEAGISEPGRRTLHRFLQGARFPRAQRWTRWTGLFMEEEKRAFYTPEMNEETASVDSTELLERIFQPLVGLDGVDAACAADVEFYLPNDLLVKMDIATMAYGLEARSPLLDHRILEFMMRLPSRMKVDGFTLKSLLKMSQRKIVDPAILQRPKQGFAVPLSHWFRGPWKSWLKEMLLSSGARIHRVIRKERIQQLMDLHTSGRRDLGHPLWALVVLEQWLRNLD